MQIGVDLGGTKIEGIAIADDGREQLRRRVQTPRGDYEGTLAAVGDLVRGIEREIGVRGSVGTGIPGAVSPATHLIKNAPHQERELDMAHRPSVVRGRG